VGFGQALELHGGAQAARRRKAQVVPRDELAADRGAQEDRKSQQSIRRGIRNVDAVRVPPFLCELGRADLSAHRRRTARHERDVRGKQRKPATVPSPRHEVHCSGATS
jgi:hypothetical protein